MKKMMALVIVSVMSSSAFGASVESAKLDMEKKNILIDVITGGGCGQHEFSLEMGNCTKSIPAQCTAKLIEVSNDTCEAFIGGTVVISLSANGLDSATYKRAVLTITGDLNSDTRELTKATVNLP